MPCKLALTALRRSTRAVSLRFALARFRIGWLSRAALPRRADACHGDQPRRLHSGLLQAIAAVALVAGASVGAQVPGKVYPIQAWCSPGWPRPFETPQQTCDWVGRGWPHPLYWYPSAAAPPHFPYGYCCDPLQPPVNPYCQYIQKPKHCPSGYFAESFVRGRGCGIAGYSDGFEGDDTMYCQRNGYDPYKNKGACNNGTPVPGVGNPINTGIYNKFQVEADLVFGSGGRERSIQRTYNSAKVPEFDVVAGVPTPRMFGPHWSSTFDRRLMRFTYGANSTTWAVRPDGKAYFFNRVGTQWIPDPDVVDTLVQTFDASGNQTGWRYVEAATQDAEIYDVDGKLIEVQARDGYPLTLSYTGGNLTSVQDPFGKTITFTYGPYGFVSSLTAPTIGTVLYRYDTDYNLTEVEHPGSVIRRYHYENTTFKGALTGITDELGVRYATFGYDGYGSATLTYLAGNVNRWSIAQVSGKLRVTDPRGYTIDQTYVNSQGVAKLTSSTQPCAACGGAGAASAYSYDTNGNLASKVDFNGKKTCYAYDGTRNLETARLEGATSAEDCTTVLETPPDRPDVRKVTTTWHATWRQPASIVEPAPGGTKTTAFTYDASGNLTQRKITAPKNDDTTFA